jgi:hypothetical protein
MHLIHMHLRNNNDDVRGEDGAHARRLPYSVSVCERLGRVVLVSHRLASLVYAYAGIENSKA